MDDRGKKQQKVAFWISSQVPSTTQPPFHTFICNYCRRETQKSHASTRRPRIALAENAVRKPGSLLTISKVFRPNQSGRQAYSPKPQNQSPQRRKAQIGRPGERNGPNSKEVSV